MMDQLYKKVERLIDSVVWQFVDRYGGDYDELRADANMIFMEAIVLYDEERSSFPTFLVHQIWYGLGKQRAKEARRKRLLKDFSSSSFYRSCQSVPSPVKYIELLDNISDDARFIVDTVMEMPEDLYQSAMKRGTTGKCVRAAIRGWLKKKGWTHRKIQTVLTELRLAVS